MKLIWVLLISTLSVVSSAQSIDSTIAFISAASMVECPIIGYSAESSELYENFESLKSIASKDQLYGFLDHESSVLAVYSAFALLDRNEIDPTLLIEKFMSNDEVVPTLCGCIGVDQSKSTAVYERLIDSYLIPQYGTRNTTYIIQDVTVLDVVDIMILSSDDAPDDLLQLVFQYNSQPKSYLPFIEIWAFERENFDAIEFMFKHNKQAYQEPLKKVLKSKLKYSSQCGGHYENERMAEMLSDLK